eukprot:gene1056-764_t
MRRRGPGRSYRSDIQRFCELAGASPNDREGSGVANASRRFTCECVGGLIASVIGDSGVSVASGALEKLNDTIGSSSAIGLACALSQGAGDVDMVSDLIQDTWENLAVIFVEEEHKDALKAAFGYSAVPFYIIFNAAGQVAKSGDSKAINIEQDLALASSSGAALSFDEDF